MGSSPSDFPVRLPAPDPPFSDAQYVSPLPVSVRRPEPLTRYVILFVLTALTTTIAGAGHYAAFVVGFTTRVLDLPWWNLLLHGFWYSAAILGILGAHEFGHYFACRYYKVDSSLPYFIPMPLFITGTLGAVIRIRQPIPGKRALFDIGIAGPIAGFIVAVPVLFLGMYLSTIVPMPTDNLKGGLVEIGEPLLFKAAQWLTLGTVANGYTVNMHPIAFGAWFGLLATALNLFPIGQLDGGHISYAVLGRKSTVVTIATVGCLIGLTFVSRSWIVWTVVTIVMLFTFGARHPRTTDEHVPLDRARLWLAAFAVVMFVLCFTPAPIEPYDLVGAR